MDTNNKNKYNYFKLINYLGAGLILWGLFLALRIFRDYQEKTHKGVYFGSNSNIQDLGTVLSGTVGLLFLLASVLFFTYTLYQTRKEMKQTQDIMVDQKKEFETQNATLSLQRFENTFFHLLDLHNDIVDKLSIVRDVSESHGIPFRSPKPTIFQKRELFKQAVDELFSHGIKDKYNSNVKYREVISDAYRTFNFDYSIHLNHYFRNLYHIYRYIFHTELISKDEKIFYANIVRAQLSDNELVIIFYNMFVPELGYPNFKFLEQEYEILKHLNINRVRLDHYNAFIEEVVESPFLKKE